MKKKAVKYRPIKSGTLRKLDQIGNPIPYPKDWCQISTMLIGADIKNDVLRGFFFRRPIKPPQRGKGK